MLEVKAAAFFPFKLKKKRGSGARSGSVSNHKEDLDPLKTYRYRIHKTGFTYLECVEVCMNVQLDYPISRVMRDFVVFKAQIFCNFFCLFVTILLRIRMRGPLRSHRIRIWNIDMHKP